MTAYDDPPPMPADVIADIEQGERAFAEHGRFVIPDAAGKPSATYAEKVEQFRCSIFNGLAQWTKETRGQPPMVARLRSSRPPVFNTELEVKGVCCRAASGHGQSD